MHGIEIFDGPDGTIIGGEFGTEGNLVGGNLSAGILSSGDTNTIIQGNIIGLSDNLRQSIGNATCGIVLVGSNGAMVGGEGTKAGNIIGGNATGIDIWGESTGALIINNQIGYRAFSGNNQNGIRLYDGAQNNIIGTGNTIAFSALSGIEIIGETSLRNTITGNSIYGNERGVITFTDIDPQILQSVFIQDVTSRSAKGSAAPGARVEIFSDMDGQARY
jgi:hypothetical protein